jgi:DNA repair exonuclease SbcCD nuclease subunit
VIIAHIADIHVRPLSRHDEYKQILNDFIDSCKLRRVDHIFVGGDIFHTKTSGLSPEYIDLMSWLLTSVAEVAELHLTLGNHDGNLLNASRQDAVSPIVNALKNPRIHLYKDSGVYQIVPGVNFCVFSLFDEEGWATVKPVEGEMNIACYHGPVMGAKSETNWDIDDGLKVEDFDAYDFALLGDIHRLQFLDYRESIDESGVTRKKPWIAYPGTPIQQNYAESLEHGYLLWEIRSKKDWDVEFIQLNNIKPFVTVDWAITPESTVSNVEGTYPAGARYRVRSDDVLSHKDAINVTSLLKKKCQASEVTFKSDKEYTTEIVNAGETTLIRDDLTNIDVIVKLMREFYSYGNKQVSDDDWKRILEHVTSYVKTTLNSDDNVRNVTWSLKELKFDNTYSYGEGNIINFASLNGIVGIFGQNRSGKSSIIGTMLYALFNTTDRGSIKNLHVINTRKPHCYVRALFDVNGVDYVLERQSTKHETKAGYVHAVTNLNVFQMKDGKAVDLAGEDRKDTEKVLRRLIGTADDCLLTSFSVQDEVKMFILQGPTRRQQILSRFLNLNIFDKMYELAKNDMNSAKSELKLMPDKEFDVLIEDQQSIVENLRSLIDVTTASIQELKKKHNELVLELSKHQNLTPTKKSDIDELEEKILTVRNELEHLREIIVTKKKTIESLQNNIENVMVNSSERKSIVDNLASISALEDSITNMKHTLDVETTTLNQHKKSLKILDEVPCGDSYPTCMFIKDAHESKSLIDEQTKKVTVALENLSNAIESMKEFNKASLQLKLKKIDDSIHNVNSLNSQLSTEKIDLLKIESSLERSESSLLTLNTNLRNLNEAFNNQDNGEVVRIKIEIDSLTNEISSLEQRNLQYATDIGRSNAMIEKLSEEKNNRIEALHRLHAFELVANAFSKKGIPNSIVSSQLPVINSEIAKLLHGVFDFTIELELDKDNDSIETYINYGDSKRIIELCSGMEKVIASIAIRVALTNMSSLPKSDMFVLDEGFGALDDSGIEACNRMLTMLSRYFRIVLVITHVDGVKEAATQILEMTKHENDARIVYS